jgi:hypothetical protein
MAPPLFLPWAGLYRKAARMAPKGLDVDGFKPLKTFT